MKSTLLYCVSISTSSSYLGLALYEFDLKKKTSRRLGHVFSLGKNKQAEKLFPTLTQLLKRNHLTTRSIGLLAVDVGPGSFTGVRVGVSAARAVAQTLNIPLIGISSLEAMAYREFKKTKKEGRAASVVQALAGEVYFAVYQMNKKGFSPLLLPSWKSEIEFSKLIRPFSLKGGMLECKEVPHPDSVAELAFERYLKTSSKKNFDYEKVVPLYLQPSWAERARRQKKF